MATITQSWHTVDDGVALFTKTWTPKDASPLAKVIFVHGLDHHVDLYSEFFEALAARRIEVLGFDQRGYGRAVKTKHDRGRTGSTSRVIADLQSIISALLPSRIPVFLIGHSMGGTIVFTYACVGPPEQIAQIRGFMGEAPDFGLPDGAPTDPTWIQWGILHALLRVYPSAQLKAVLDARTLSRDVAVQEHFSNDPLCHHFITVEGIMGHFDRVHKLVSKGVKPAKEVKSIWIGHGTKDLCTDYDESKKWIEHVQLQDKELRTYDGCYHNLHAEIPGVKEKFAADVGDWILARTA